jgi:peptidoglycan-associated lipoprotein
MTPTATSRRRGRPELVMRRLLASSFPVLTALLLAGCPTKPKQGECKTSADCAGQEGYGKVCIEGRCQECGADSDCKAGFACRESRCVPKPQCAADADCPAGQPCQDGRCVPAQPQGPVSREEAKPKAPAVEAGCADAGAFTIRFGFNDALLGSEGQGTLQKLAGCLKKAPAKRIVIAGHCDERGTTQYNIALGSRRAEVAKRYLSDLGIAARMETVSYGKERPLCTESNEECWSRNRRDDFQVER